MCVSRLSVVLMNEECESQSPSALLPMKQDQMTFHCTPSSVCSAALEASSTDVNMQLT